MNIQTQLLKYTSIKGLSVGKLMKIREYKSS
jgi:hypothetical protein